MNNDAQKQEFRLELTVLLEHKHDAWFARSFEIDYFAEGATLEEAEANFISGLGYTIARNFQIHGNADRVFQRQAPGDLWLKRFESRTNPAGRREVPVYQTKQGKSVVASLDFRTAA